MIERIEDMPPGTVGLRASGTLSKSDYTDVLEPALRDGVASGELRLVFLLTDFHGLAPGAWAEDVKTGLQAMVRDHAAWRRFAFVTDVGWVARSMRLFTWMVPGDVLVAEPGQLEEAKEWVRG
ncbi:STAS/SEC14 domain-containing protein [Conexibacter sp. JD483]|uniref:STAS/SEC14 domain-containing protein n=1 Tax=unclassified Conexibacter TaxID=2627773 RepID=UPI002720BF1C|nr:MULTISPECIES: STAS/SEC14 domain-containing protein [unclassified Conexibacter]MDO8185668.1 STAS/SEC14 domain-containing protein [Conexibacter sp. CPCC 205706]MDO8198841.1 STAS/SEC14 domain-containing protein [Conexibacter sp. CPCC 205762]MDR9372074.1 STAS/SEC14 domain-containing protein [Conexibacter sp. JD483]